MSNINKHKFSLYSKLFKEETKTNLSLALHIRKCYNSCTDKVYFKSKVNFEWICERLETDEYLIDHVFGCNYSSFNDSDSIHHIEKCMDELIVLKSKSLI